MRTGFAEQHSEQIRCEQWIWKLSVQGRIVELPIDIQLAPGALAPDSQSPTVLIGGYGEGGRSTAAGLTALLHAGTDTTDIPAIGVVTLPYRKLDPTPQI